MAAKPRRRIRIISRPRTRRPFWDGIARIFDFTGSMNTPAQKLPRDLAVQYALWRASKTVGDTMWSTLGYRPCTSSCCAKTHAERD